MPVGSCRSIVKECLVVVPPVISPGMILAPVLVHVVIESGDVETAEKCFQVL